MTTEEVTMLKLPYTKTMVSIATEIFIGGSIDNSRMVYTRFRASMKHENKRVARADAIIK